MTNKIAMRSLIRNAISIIANQFPDSQRDYDYRNAIFQFRIAIFPIRNANNPISISHSLRRNPSPSPKISVPIADEIPHNHSQSEIPHNHSEMENQPPMKLFSASLTLRNKVSLATTIASKLSPAQRKLFEETCFGPWLRVQHPGGDANLTHLWLQTMTSDLPDSIQRGEEEIWFHFPPTYTCFGLKEFCLITGLRFGHDDVGRYTRHITRPSWLSRVFPDESIEKPNLHVDDMKKLFNKKDGFTRMNDVDVVRLCLLLLLYAGFLGREARKPIPHELILLVEDLNAWNLFPWGSYIWKATWTKLSSAFDDRKSLRGDGSKYTLSGFVWAFKIWIFEAFPAMKTYAIKTSNDIPRAISWKRKRMLDWEDLIPYATINNEANIPLMRLTPTEAELATDWWQASQRFLDGTNDEQPPLPPLREPSPHPEPSPDRPDYTPLQREPSPIPSHHRASSPPSPHDRRPAKMPRLLSPCLPRVDSASPAQEKPGITMMGGVALRDGDRWISPEMGTDFVGDGREREPRGDDHHRQKKIRNMGFIGKVVDAILLLTFLSMLLVPPLLDAQSLLPDVHRAGRPAMVGDMLGSQKPMADKLALMYSPFIALGFLAVLRGLLLPSTKAAFANGPASGLKKRT
ncbi:hypothetical protein F3Y22_tig00113725pilonHSYRG00444 [Hibiscus syriacus]|uniref:DUF1985 domain-containing protein n=1 Tax=Hibiscus syriacus TaxID=106335 RepID=A0A6A2WMJ0_HIBSY|nr:hypothetical protein F3Y22_tig00113725pilonHSYRG00444 [Hibiscus syriacus]